MCIRDRFKILVTSAGALTAAGKLYEDETITALETNPYETGQIPRREGDTEYVKMRTGMDRITRHWDAAKSVWTYTALGRAFFSQKRISWVVKVPATFAGTRANGTPYLRDGHFPLNENVAIPMAYSQAQRDRKIRAHVRSLYPNEVLAE